MLQSPSSGLPVYLQANTIPGGSAVTITNSGGLFAMQSGAWNVGITNTLPGWQVKMDSTSIVNSAGWVVSIANTAGWLIGVGSVSIVNSAGWTVGVGSTSIVNSAGWVVFQANTAGMTINIINSSGWIIDSMIESSSMGVSGVARTPGFAVIAASSQDNVIVSAVVGRRIRVISMDIMAQVAVNARFQSGTGGTNLTGFSFIGGSGGLVRPFNPAGWFQTATSTLLSLNLTAATSVGGCLTYLEI